MLIKRLNWLPKLLITFTYLDWFFHTDVIILLAENLILPVYKMTT